MNLSPQMHERRSTLIDALETEPFDLVIVGGGITGAGIAREASLQGIRVALIEAVDFAAGTSSRSSKLIHGGLRYLERREINLVRKTALERKEIRSLAPHLAEPRWMVIPMRSRIALYSLRVAVKTYEQLGAVAQEDGHRGWSGSTLAEMEPVLKHKALPHALAYREFLTDDARLVLANIRSAEKLGSRAINHAAVTDIRVEGGKSTGVTARCSLSGREFHVRAKTIVNAAGPWVEALQRMENPDAKPLLHLSRGIHISLPASRLPINNLLVLKAQDERRLFAIRRGEVVYIGTTDTTETQGAKVWPEITREDVDYLLEPIPRHFDLDPIGASEVVGAWAGLRPLIADSTKKNPSEISRRDEVLIGPSGVISIAGGKLTGYRGMARRVLATIGEQLDRNFAPLPLEKEPVLPGGDFDGDLEALASTLRSQHQLSESEAYRMVRLYGSETHEVLQRGSQRLDCQPSIFDGEIRWAIEEEGARNLEDIFYRRLRLPLYHVGSEEAIEAIGNAVAQALGWSPETRREESRALSRQLHSDLSFSGNTNKRLEQETEEAGKRPNPSLFEKASSH